MKPQEVRKRWVIVLLAIAFGLAMGWLGGSMIVFHFLGKSGELRAVPSPFSPRSRLTASPRLTAVGTPSPTATPFLPAATASPLPTSTMTPLPTHTLTPTPPVIPPQARELLSRMTLSQKVGQLLMVGVGSKTLTPPLCHAIQALKPGGIVYTKGDVDSPAQLQQLSQALQQCVAQAGLPPLIIAIDHEGQYVDRFPKGATKFPSAMALGALQNPEAVYQAALAAGQELRFSGVTMVLGPVADVLANWDNGVISTRSFGGDPDAVAENVSAAVRGFLQAGLLVSLKHFPGHGGVAGDSHEVLPVDQATVSQIQEVYLPPFEAGIRAGAQAVMVGHIAFSNMDYRPASLSPRWHEMLRQQMGFQGMILTDSLGMAGARQAAGGVVPAGLLALQAGNDMLLVPSYQTARQIRARLEQAVMSGEVSQQRLDDAVLQILALKMQMQPGVPPAAPQWSENAALAYQLGYRSVTLVREMQPWVPWPDGVHHVVIVGPRDGWGLYPVLQQAFTDRGIQSKIYIYSGPWLKRPVPERGLITKVSAALRQDYDAALVLTWDSHLSWVARHDDFQIRLVKQCLAVGKPVVVVALKSPVDAVDFPQVPVYLATYGTLPGQIQGLADVLVGKAQPQGHWPLRPLP